MSGGNNTLMSSKLGNLLSSSPSVVPPLPWPCFLGLVYWDLNSSVTEIPTPSSLACLYSSRISYYFYNFTMKHIPKILLTKRYVKKNPNHSSAIDIGQMLQK